MQILFLAKVCVFKVFVNSYYRRCDFSSIKLCWSAYGSSYQTDIYSFVTTPATIIGGAITSGDSSSSTYENSWHKQIYWHPDSTTTNSSCSTLFRRLYDVWNSEMLATLLVLFDRSLFSFFDRTLFDSLHRRDRSNCAMRYICVLFIVLGAWQRINIHIYIYIYPCLD